MFTEYDKAIAGFLSAAATLLIAFNVNVPWLNPTTIAALTPFISMITIFAIPNLKPKTPEAGTTTSSALGASTSPIHPTNLKLLLPLALVLSFATVAFADGPPTRQGRIASPYTLPEPAFSWTGPYVGAVGAWHFDADSGAVGALAGVQYQFSSVPLVVGAEADILRLWGNESSFCVDDCGDKEPILGSSRKDWLGSARLRAGVPIGPFLPFATFGWAFTQVDTTTPSGSSVEWHNGYVYGGGVDVAAGKNISVRAEFLQYEFNDSATALVSDERVVRLGLTYKF